MEIGRRTGGAIDKSSNQHIKVQLNGPASIYLLVDNSTDRTSGLAKLMD